MCVLCKNIVVVLIEVDFDLLEVHFNQALFKIPSRIPVELMVALVELLGKV